MGGKTLVSFDLRKLKETCTVPDLIDFFGNYWKEIKTQTEKRNIQNCKKYGTE